MEKRRLSLIFICGALIISSILCNRVLCAEQSFENSRIKVYRSGPSQKEIDRNFEYEREKERNAWDMLKNSFFDIDLNNPFYDNQKPFHPRNPSTQPKTR